MNNIKKILALMIITGFISITSCNISMGADGAEVLDPPRGIDSGEITGDVKYLARISGLISDGGGATVEATLNGSYTDTSVYSTTADGSGNYNLYVRVPEAGGIFTIDAIKNGTTSSTNRDDITVKPGDHLENADFTYTP